MIKIIILSLILLSGHATLADNKGNDADPASKKADSTTKVLKQAGKNTATDDIIVQPFIVTKAEMNYIREECQKFAREDGVAQQGIGSYLKICIAELTTAVEKALSAQRLMDAQDKLKQSSKN